MASTSFENMSAKLSASSSFEAFPDAPSFADFAADFPVASVVHHKEYGLDFADVHDTICENVFVAVRFHYSSNEDIMVGKVNRTNQFTFHVYAALFNHGGSFKRSIESFEERCFVFVLA
jgi:hypothetical protein